MDYTEARRIASALLDAGYGPNDVQLKCTNNDRFNAKYAVTFKVNGKTVVIREVE